MLREASCTDQKLNEKFRDDFPIGNFSPQLLAVAGLFGKFIILLRCTVVF
ncbi:hypothetical protein [Herbaspirillum sp. C7C8]|jgi:hypothetical protein|nr:hypothetical protein [Herbaspirillum sp. C7C8]MCI1004758.1 hypothetical protein [Herbaspirillum sp. C7C8]